MSGIRDFPYRRQGAVGDEPASRDGKKHEERQGDERHADDGTAHDGQIRRRQNGGHPDVIRLPGCPGFLRAADRTAFRGTERCKAAAADPAAPGLSAWPLSYFCCSCCLLSKKSKKTERPEIGNALLAVISSAIKATPRNRSVRIALAVFSADETKTAGNTLCILAQSKNLWDLSW